MNDGLKPGEQTSEYRVVTWTTRINAAVTAMGMLIASLSAFLSFIGKDTQVGLYVGGAIAVLSGAVQFLTAQGYGKQRQAIKENHTTIRGLPYDSSRRP